MKPHEVMVTMSCSGNRRKQLYEKYNNIKGLHWDVGSIGNAVYKGVLVRDLLLNLGYNLDELKGKHLVTEGLDMDF